MRSDSRPILAIIQDNPRAKLTDIAKELGVSVTAVKKRMENLEKRGVIRGYKTIIDYSKLGYTLCAFVALSIEPKRKEQVMEGLSGIREVIELYDITGSSDALAKVYCRSMEDLRELLAFNIGAMDGVRSTATMMVLKERDVAIKLLEDG
jgi:DNA-binding Lrp family transcriptional regulator